MFYSFFNIGIEGRQHSKLNDYSQFTNETLLDPKGTSQVTK